ncbi:hypothetical protein ABZP36_028360 [Zizania latifolia]
MENLWVEVQAASAFARKCSSGQDPMDSSLHEHYFGEQKFQAPGTPSAPPIAGDGDEAIFDTVGFPSPEHLAVMVCFPAGKLKRQKEEKKKCMISPIHALTLSFESTIFMREKKSIP